LPHRLPLTPLFPYTTLFRSQEKPKPVPVEPPKVVEPKPAPSPKADDRPKAVAKAPTVDTKTSIAKSQGLAELSSQLKSLRGSVRSEEHTSELQSRENLVCRL